MTKKDWTVGVDGRSNSSAEYRRAVSAVEALLRNHTLGTPPESTARLIVSQLAHVHGFGPVLVAKADGRA